MTSGSRRVLVTGGFGFIGSHLVERLLADPRNHVHVVDSLETSPIDLVSLLGELGSPARLTYDTVSMQAFLSATQERFDHVYHLCSIVGPARLRSHTGQIVGRSVEDAQRLVEFIERRGGRVLVASSSEVYGRSGAEPCAEDAFLVLPPVQEVRTEYALAKLSVEATVLGSVRRGGVDGTVVRLFNACGPRRSPAGGFVLPRFVSQALSGRPLTVFGDGSQERCFTHVQEIAEGLVLAMHRGEAGAVYNLGNPENRVSILGLARAVLREASSASEIHLLDPRTVFGHEFRDRPAGAPDVSKAAIRLGWCPKLTVAEIVRDAVRYTTACHPVS